MSLVGKGLDLSIMATLISSVPKVAVVKWFNCISIMPICSCLMKFVFCITDQMIMYFQYIG